MLNNSNNFSVEAIVAKYVTAVKTQWEATPEYKAWSSPLLSADFPSGTDFAFAPHQQLLATLWSAVNGNPEEGDILGEVVHYIGFFNRSILTEEEFAFLVSNYKKAVNHIFDLRDEWLWNEISFNGFPEEMCELMTKLLDYKEGDTLYIPFVEYGDLAIKFPECKISGYVSSRKIWAFCCIRLEANGIKYNIPYSEDAIDLVVPEKNSTDCIICDASAAMLDSENVMQEFYDGLKDGGRMTIIASPQTLAAMGKKELLFRKQILKDRALEAVVQLPANIFKTSDESFFVLCIDKRKNDEPYTGAVMADASFATRDFGVKSSLKRFDVERFIEAVQHTDVPENENICKRIPYEKLDADILLPAYYLVKKPGFAMELNKVLKEAELDKTVTTGVMPAVTLKDLSTTFEKANIAVSELSPVCDSGKKDDFAVVKKPCVLLCSNAHKILVGYITDVPETGVAISNRINCFETIDADVASSALLLLEEYVQNQLKAMSAGKLTRKFSNNLLSKVKVYPLIYDADKEWEVELEAMVEQQRMQEIALKLECEESAKEEEMRKVADSLTLEEACRESHMQEIADSLAIEEATFDEKLRDTADHLGMLEKFKKESLEQHERMQKKLYSTIEQQKQDSVSQYEKYRKSVRLRKHALTQSLSAFGSMFNALMNCRRRQCGFLEDSDKLSEISELTVADAFAYMESRLRSIQQKIAAIADVEEDLGKPESIEPIEFINSYIDSNKAGWLHFVAEIGWEDFVTNRATKDIPDSDGNGFVVRKGDPINTLYFPKPALAKIFDNIIANAIAHGFTEPNRDDYKVRFSWMASGMDMKLVIENNGKPISDEVNTADILEYGFSTSLNNNGHNGIGCSEIATIMHDFDGEVNVISTPNEKYTVKYILTFKRTNTVLSL